MTANDSKSTPKKAEDATRHPLALLAETWRAAAGPVYGPEEAVFQQCADELESALRAQAEAEAGLRDVAGRVVRKLETAHELAEVVNNQRPHGGNKLNMIDQLERIEGAINMLRAALAQAGAGSEGQGEGA